METVTMPQVRKSGGLIGAEIRGLDLTREYPEETYQAILRAWAEHGVTFLRDQQLSAEQRDAFASRLGEIRVRQQVRKAIHANVRRFEGWTRGESLPLLSYLFAVGTRPEFTTRFRWAPGSIAMWDNRQTWHFAVNDYQGQRRVMHRILLAGPKPTPAAITS
jgi:alpha-ketoglutarate-dependent taurine dioxygenase